MPAVSASFSGQVTEQKAFVISEESNHALTLAQVTATQKSSDQNWDNATINYWGFADIVDGQGTQHGYFANSRGSDDRDWGTFEGRVAPANGEISVEGTWQITNGSGKLKGITGNGTFSIRLASTGNVEGSWQGNYDVPAVTAQHAG
jgi:hypothetical protein